MIQIRHHRKSGAKCKGELVAFLAFSGVGGKATELVLFLVLSRIAPYSSEIFQGV